MKIKQKRDKLLEEELCNHCLGRQFAKLGYGLENYERGAILKTIDEIDKEDFIRAKIPKDTNSGGDCSLCNGLFNNLNQYFNLVLDSLQNYEFNTLLIGSRPPSQVLNKEEEIKKKYGRKYTESIRSELNRLIGKKVGKEFNDIKVDFERPDITAIIDMEQNEINLQVSSLLIFGKYNKYSRNISQTEWRHSEESVQEILQAPFIEAAQAKNAKFHGAGREDLDVRCFGRREFVLELVHPQKRKLDIKILQNKVNNYQNKIEVFNMKFTYKNKKKEVKQRRANKIYRAMAELSQEVDNLDELKKLVGLIKQRTPQRVNRTRVDRVRKRKIYNIQVEKITNKKIELIIKAEAGAYIKELISGDDGRTKPSVSQILGCKAECKKLDVLDID